MKLVRIICMTAVAAGAAFAQNSDIGLLLGASIRVNGKAVVGTVQGTVSGSGQISYAAQLHNSVGGQLYLELPLTLTGRAEGKVGPGTVIGGTTSALFFTPGLRWRFTPASRVSLYAEAGAGLA